MNATDVVARLHEHRAWVNQKLLDAAASLSAEALHKPLAIGQGSVWKSLLHMHAAEYVWLESMLGNEHPVLPGDVADKLPGNQQGAGGIASLAELRSKWKAHEGRWRTYLDGLKDCELEQTVTKANTAGKKLSSARIDALLHVCTHAQYTAAQVVNMLRQLGVTALPDPMLISKAREEFTAR
jgi:uncharacterized damage-inducible protein DinB